MPVEDLTFERKQDTVIFHFPETYGIGSWGQILQLIRNNAIPGAKYIVIDLSRVKHIDDCGGEFYFIKEEFVKIDGKDIVLTGMPPQFRSILDLIEEDWSPQERIKKYLSVDDAVRAIK
jgi:hypothetical protein